MNKIITSNYQQIAINLSFSITHAIIPENHENTFTCNSNRNPRNENMHILLQNEIKVRTYLMMESSFLCVKEIGPGAGPETTEDDPN